MDPARAGFHESLPPTGHTGCHRCSDTEFVEEASNKLAQGLTARSDLIRGVHQLDSGVFIERNGLWFLPTEETTRVSSGLIKAKPLSRQSRNQTGGRRQDSSSAVRAILDDPPIHIRPVCSRNRGCEGQEPCGFNAFQHAHGCTPPPPRPQDSSHVLSRVSS